MSTHRDPPTLTRTNAIIGASALAVVAIGFWWSQHRAAQILAEPGRRLFLGTPPFHHELEPRWSWSLAIIGIAALAGGSWMLRRRTRIHVVFIVSVIGNAAYTVALAATDGWDRLTFQIRQPNDFLAQLPWVHEHGWSAFYSSFQNETLYSTFPTHVRSHPAGMVTLLGGLDAIGLRGPGWVTAVVLTAAATIPLSVGVAVFHLTGGEMTRWAVVLTALTPGAVFFGTTPDALFAAVAAAAIALGVVAIKRTSWPLALGAGVVGGLAVSLSYGVIPLIGLMWLAVALRSRRPMLLAGMGAGLLSVIGAWAIVGFNWFAGFEAVRRQYELDLAQQSRPYSYFLIANLVVFAIVVGPAIIMSVGAVRRDHLLWLVIPAVIAVGIANVSGLSKGEVERIWLPFLPWVTVAGCWLLHRLSSRGRSVALAAQIGTAILLQALLFGPW